MRAALLVLLLAVPGTLAACGDAPAPPREAATRPAAAPEPPTTVEATWRGEGALVEFTVPNMDCSGCASVVKERLQTVPGVVSAEADAETKLVRVTLGDADARDAVIAAIPAALQPGEGKKFEVLEAPPAGN
jgi:copper chaperone CopZ